MVRSMTMTLTSADKCANDEPLADEALFTVLCPAVAHNNFTEIVSFVGKHAKLHKVPLSEFGSVLCTKILLNNVSSKNCNGGLLSTEQRSFIGNLIKICEKFQNDNFCSKHFIEMISSVHVLPIEIIWRLHLSGLLDVITYLTYNEFHSERSSCLSEALSHILCASIKDEPITIQIIRDICSTLITNSFLPQWQVSITAIHNAKQVTIKILNNVTGKILDNILSSKLNTASVPILYEVIRKGGLVDKFALQKFCMQQLSFILCYCPMYKVSCAISKQSYWSFFKAPTLLVNMFIELLVPLSFKDVALLLKQMLETREVNWHMLLTFISVSIIVCYDGVREITELINGCLIHAFESSENEAMFTSFLLARQAANEGPDIFPSYVDWFQGCFGGSSSVANSKKNFIFLMTFLSSLVPHEPASYLRAHIYKAPQIPPKCQSIYSDYKNLAKARLLDLEGDIYESQRESEETKAKMDVEDALSQFEKSGKIPSFVLETYMFRKPYFMARFLTVLLKPTLISDISDTKMKFIELLHCSGKIPSNMYSEYLQICEQKATDLMASDLHEVASVNLSTEFFREILITAGQLISALEMNDARATVASLNKITATLKIMLSKQKCSNGLTCDTVVIDSSHRLNLGLMKIVDFILTTFCKIHIVLLHQASAFPLQIASRYVTMMTSFSILYKPLVTRLWNLLLGKEHLKLELGHISGLGHFLFHLHLSGQAFPFIMVKTKSHDCIHRQGVKGPFVQCLSDQLSVLGENEMQFSLRLITSYLCVAVVKESVNEISVPLSLLKKFLLICKQSGLEFQGNPSTRSEFLDVKLIHHCHQFKELCNVYNVG